MPIMLQYSKELVQNELLSRKLAYSCAKKITWLVNETEAMSQPQQGGQSGSDHAHHPVISAFLELTNDLPNCAPSALPMPPRQNNQEIRHRIRECEQYIKLRSQAVESKQIIFHV